MIFNTTSFLLGLSSISLPLWFYNKEKFNKNKLDLQYNILVAQVLGHAATLRDYETGIHNYRVTYIASLFGEELGLDRTSLQNLMKGAFLHDIGKIGIADKILLKEGPLSFDEREIMKKHSLLGVEIVKDMHWFNNSLDVILHHHEKFDGTGYPNSLKAEKIPYLARIFSFIDVFDALISVRPYKKAFTLDKALKIIKESTPTQFDPSLADKFISFALRLHFNIYSKNEDELKALLIKRRKIIFGM